MERIFLGLGSNLGDRMANLEAAINALRAAGVRPVRSSPVYETDPVGGPPGQGKYFNAVVEVTTTLEPREMLELCKRIERQLGRQSSERWAARLIDIDILLWGDRTVQQPDLQIPHPEMARRAFVLVPLDEIAPDVYNIASKCTVHELALQLPSRAGVERFGEPFTVADEPGGCRDS